MARVKVISIFIFIFWECSAERVVYTGYQTHRFFPATEKDREILMILQEINPGVIFMRQVGKVDFPVDICFPPHMQTDLLKTLQNQMRNEMITDDMEALMDHESNVFGLESIEADDFPFDKYWDFAKVQGFYTHMKEQNLNTCKIINYGQSSEGRPLQAFMISDKDHGPKNKSILLIDGGTHAREWITVMSCCYLLNEFLSGKAEYKELIKNFDIIFICVVNPDGFVYTWTKDRLWRKTRADNKDLLCKGVDPNRNFGFGHKGPGSSADKCSEIYHGTEPFSVPETKFLRDFILSWKNIKSYWNLHSYSQMVLLSYGCSSAKEKHDYPDDEFNFDLKLANQAVDAIKSVHGTEYTCGNSKDILYEACGCANDWAKAVAKIPFTYTFELRDAGKFGFVLPASQILGCAEELSFAYTSVHKTVMARLAQEQQQSS